jgi:hypothetical protein
VTPESLPGGRQAAIADDGGLYDDAVSDVSTEDIWHTINPSIPHS